MFMRRAENFFVRHASAIAISALTVLMVWAGSIFYHQGQAAADSRNWVEHTYEVRGNVRLLLSRIDDAVIGERGYLISGNEDYLKSYNLAIGRLPADGANADLPDGHSSIAEQLELLGHMTADNPVQRQNVEQISLTTKEMLAYLAENIDMRKHQGAAFLQTVDLARVQKPLDHLREILNNMAAEESRLLVSRLQTDADNLWLTNLLIFSAFSLFYLLAALAIRLCQMAEKRAQSQIAAQREEATKTTRLLAAIVESSEEAIIGKTLDGFITSWNTGAEKLLGYSPAEAVGQPIKILIPPHCVVEEKRIMEQIREGRRVLRLETQRVSKDGEYIDVLITMSPILDTEGAILGVSTVAHDIRARKQSEADIRRHIQALKRSNQELDDFAYIASHDLKEPLRGLTNNAMFLKEDFGDKLDEPTIRHLDRMTYLCQRMEKLVDDLLYFSRLGRQDLAVQKTDLNEVIKDIKMMMETTLREKNATVSIPKLLPVITCDLPRVTEVFRNLITNAVKYNKSDDKCIEIGCADAQSVPGSNDNDRQIFYVRDNGIGIQERFFNDIFRIFKRLNEEDDTVKGTGVGLTFVRKIIERHDGRIWLDSKVGQGTTFYFTLNNKMEAQS